MLQSVCPAATAAARPPVVRVVPRALASGRLGLGWRHARVRTGPDAGGTPTTALRRAQCSAGPEPVEARTDGAVPRKGVQEQEDAELAPEQLELLEDEAIGDDEGRSPTDYDRRAHIFEESSRVFRALKQRRDGDGDGGVKVGAAAGGHG
uniref:Uncharacterized protein n=1 Tax=Avena sativa TaxID=4498 RepID=A0ACD5X2I7_AVESA